MDVIKSDVKIRNKKIIENIICHKPFYEVYNYYLKENKIPQREYIKNVIKENIPNMAEETINRRASTISGWIQWIISAQI